MKKYLNTLKKYKRIYLLFFIFVLILAALSAALIFLPFKTVKASNHNAIYSTYKYKCIGVSSSLPCLEQHYQSVSINQGVGVAVAQVKSAYAKDAVVQADCHQLMHVIGRTEADLLKNVDDAYAHGDNFCWSGYYHGVMESIVLKIGISNLTSKLPTICANIKAHKPYSFYHYNCVHGLGHGIMAVNGSNLFASLITCDLLTDPWERSSCYGGVFMENEMDEVNPDHKTAYLKTDQPMYPCTAVDEKYKEQCYLMQTSHALRISNYNFSTVFSECDVLESNYKDTCYQSLGRDSSGSTTSNIDKTRNNCMLGLSLEAQSNCIIGAVKDFVSYYHNDQQATLFCNSIINSDIKQTCISTKEQYYRTF